MGKLPKYTKEDITIKNINDYKSFIFSLYNQKPKIKTQIFFGDLGAGTVVGTATLAIQTSGQPNGLSENFLLDPNNADKRPLTDNVNKPYPQITTTATASGWTFNLPDIGIGESDFVRITLKSSVLTSTQTVKLTSTTGSDTLTWSAQNINIMNNKASGWTTLTLDMSKATKAGTIDYNKFTKIEIVASAIGVLSLYELQTANNETNFIGAIHTGQINCVNEFTPTLEKDIVDVMCKTSVTDVALGGVTAEAEIVTKDMNLEDVAALMGTNIITKTVKSWSVVNGAKNGQSGNYNNTISTDTLTLPATRLYDVPEVKVSVNGVEYRPTFNSSNVGRGEFCYTQDPTTFTFTFTIGDGDDNGKTPVVELMISKQNIPTLATIHDLGNYFYLERKTQAGVGKVMESYYYKCMLMQKGTEVADYTNHTYTLKVFPVIKDGQQAYYEEALIA